MKTATKDTRLYLGRAVRARLDVVREFVRDKRRRAKVDDFDFAFLKALHDNVLGLEVAMHNVEAVEERQRFETLDRNLLEPRQRKVRA